MPHPSALPAARGGDTQARQRCRFFRLLLLGLLAVPPSLRTLGAVWQGDLVNPDAYMRLVRLEDGLRAGQVGYRVAADASGAGTVLHWSHLLDSLLVLLALPGQPWLGWHRALFVAAALCGPLSVWLLGAALVWAVAPLADRRFLWAAPVVAGLSAPVMTYGALGVAHHHVLLVAGCVFVAGCLGRAAAGDLVSGWRGGVAAAACLWLTPETMPALLCAFALPVLYRRRPGARAALALCGAGLAAILFLAWLVDPPDPRFAAPVDRLSVVYLGLGAAIAAGGMAIWALPRLRLGPSIGVVLAGACLAGWVAAFPDLLRGPAGVLDPATARAFFADIAEMQPVRNAGEAGLFLLPGLVSAALLAAIAWRRRSLPWAYAAAVCAMAVALTAWHVRFAAFPAACTAAAMPVLLTRASRLRRPAVRPAARLATFFACVLLPDLPAFAGAMPPPAAPYACPVRAAQALLAPVAGAVVLTGVNSVPELLYRTRVRTVGSLYHRNAAAYLRLRAAWNSRPADQVPAAVRATGAAYILLCPSRAPATAPPATLWDELRANTKPPWLQPVGHGEATDTAAAPILWRILP
jgi:hypothetical protein